MNSPEQLPVQSIAQSGPDSLSEKGGEAACPLDCEQIPASRSRKGGVFLLVIACAAIALACVLVLGRYLTADGKKSAQAVIHCGNYTLTNRDFSYYYWSEYFYYLNNQTAVPETLDTTRPLDRQMYDADRTWQDFMIDQTLNTIGHTMALVQEAEASSFVLDGEYEASLEAVIKSFRQYALQGGFTDEDGWPDLDAYLRDSYGPEADEASFSAYLRHSYLSAAYSDYLYDQPVFTPEEVEAFYDENAETYAGQMGLEKTDDVMRSARMVLIAPEDPEKEEDWTAAETQCRSLMTTWQSQGALEDDLATMATAYSDDAGSAAVGGLMEGIWPGRCEAALDAWLFADGRKAGDAEVLKLETGYAIVTLSSLSEDIYWQQVAREDLRYETYQNNLMTLLNAYSLQVNREAIVITAPADLYEDTET